MSQLVDDVLSAEAVTAACDACRMGRPVHYWATTGSTNDELKRLAENGAQEGALAIADEQLVGRGRLDRRWMAPPRSSLLMSLLFRPTFLSPVHVQQLTMICSLAAADAVTALTGLMIELKWPNDLVLAGKKLAGTLTELGFDADGQLAWAVVGVGINVNVDFAAMPDLSNTAISLSMALGLRTARLPLLRAFLANVDLRYDALRAGASAHHEWAARLTTLGRPVTATTPAGEYAGVAESVDETGALLLRLEDGHTLRVLAGDVTLKR